MSRPYVSLAAAISILFFAFDLSAQSSLVMKGTVIGDAHVPVSGAFVVVRDINQPYPERVSATWETTTEADGQFTLSVKEGCYDVFVSSGNFLPFTKRLCLTTKTNQEMKIRLKRDTAARLYWLD